ADSMDGTESEPGPAGPRQPGHDDQAVPEQVQADVLQVVGARSADADEVQRHRGGVREKRGGVGDRPAYRAPWMGAIRRISSRRRAKKRGPANRAPRHTPAPWISDARRSSP